MSATHFSPATTILSVATHLPPERRTNDWWDASVVEQWTKGNREPGHAKAESAVGEKKGAAIVARRIRELRDDPFQGVRERRVLPLERRAVDMELEAAKDALERAGKTPTDVDFILSFQMCPDYLHNPSAAFLQHALGCSENTWASVVSCVCDSFLAQLRIADGLMRQKPGSVGLLVQSTTLTRLVDPAHQASAMFGDGASAVVVSNEVAPDRGYRLKDLHQTVDGSLWGSLTCGDPKGFWWAGQPVRSYSPDSDNLRRMFQSIGDTAVDMFEVMAQRNNIAAGDVDFFGCHQGTAWLPGAVSEALGMEKAKTANSFSFAGNLTAVNLPLVLDVAAREHQIASDDLMLLYAGGTGGNYSMGLLQAV